jgi:triosephosphate isomerase
LQLSAQDVSSFADDGAFTGEVSAAMLRDVGCRYALVGHSERRQYFGESNPALLAKMNNAMAAGLVPVLCVGETLAEREAGQYLDVIFSQLAILAEVNAASTSLLMSRSGRLVPARLLRWNRLPRFTPQSKRGACKMPSPPLIFASSTAAV